MHFGKLFCQMLLEINERSKKETQFRQHLELQDMKVKNGVVVCATCGSYCGQCGFGPLHGMTEEKAFVVFCNKYSKGE